MTQSDQILSYLKRGRSIDPQVALRLFYCFRLAARIRDLRAAGNEIITERVRNREGKAYARYSLA
jgi:hypothetical protein